MNVVLAKGLPVVLGFLVGAAVVSLFILSEIKYKLNRMERMILSWDAGGEESVERGEEERKKLEGVRGIERQFRLTERQKGER